MLERLLTLKEVAEAVRVSVPTLRRAVKAGELPCVRAGHRGQIRVSQEGVDAFLSARPTVVHVRPPTIRRVSPRSDADETHAKAELPEGKVADEPALPPAVPLPERAGEMGAGRSYRLLTADVQVGLAALAAGSANCIVTSPPYFWQRDYGMDGQIGHEGSIVGYVSALVAAFREARRVLADDGTLFLNLGDAYYNAKGRPHGHDPKHSARIMARQRLRAVDGPGLGLPRKSLIGLPWRVALAMQEEGWVLRSSIVWHRPNALGEPTGKDRPWRTHENVFLFSKGPRYFFDRSGLGKDEDVWTIRARPEKPYAHCAPFPVELVERCIACGCPEDGTVLDPFMGSGTTMVAALRSGRSVVGVELNDGYAALAERRLQGEAAKQS